MWQVKEMESVYDEDHILSATTYSNNTRSIMLRVTKACPDSDPVVEAWVWLNIPRSVRRYCGCMMYNEANLISIQRYIYEREDIGTGELMKYMDNIH